MNIVNLYSRGGFVTFLVLMDVELEKVKDNVGLLEVTITAAQEHFDEIKRRICLMKERTQCLTSDMLYYGIKYRHEKILIHLVYNFCLWLNAFLLKSGLSIEYYPCEIVTQRFVN